jgi:Porin subfamily
VVAVPFTGLQLTTGWNINAAYEHYWTPAFHSSVYGGFAEVKYNSTANAGLCNIENNAANGGATATLFTTTPAGCNNNWSTWWIGSRTQWDVTKTFYMGVDVLYSKLESASINSTGTFSANSTATGTQAVSITGSAVVNGVANSQKDVDNWAIRFRVHKDFLP